MLIIAGRKVAITSKEYKNLYLGIQELVFRGIRFDEEDLVEFDEIRKTNKKYKKEIDYIYLYPRHNIKKAQGLANDLLELSKKLNIKIKFYKLKIPDYAKNGNPPEYRVERHIYDEGTYVYYYKDGIDITSIINI